MAKKSSNAPGGDDNLQDLIKKHGAITGAQYEAFVDDLPVLSTGIFSIDMAAGPIDPVNGNGGIRARDIWEVCGVPGAGKSGLAHSIIKTTQHRYPGQSVVGLFSEPPDIKRMKKEGIDTDSLIILGCAHKDSHEKQLLAENCLNALLDFSADDKIKLIVIDSVATLFTAKEQEKNEDLRDAAPVAALAKVFNRFIADFSKKTKVAPLLLVNHYRVPINTGFSFVPPSLLKIETPGGRTKEFLSMVRILATSNPSWKDDGKTLHSTTGRKIQDGLDITYTMFRNKYANKDSYRTCKVNFNFPESRFNDEEITLTYSDHFTQRNEAGELQSILDPRVIQKGAWFYIGDKPFQGKDNAVSYLKENPGVVKSLQSQILSRSEEFFGDEKEFSVAEELES